MEANEGTIKKIVLLIVEGKWDEVSLGLIFTRIFTADDVKVCVVKGDITSEDGIVPGNVVSRVESEINAFASQSRVCVPDDFRRVIHLTDMDGAYIPNAFVIQDLTKNHSYYLSNGIYTNDKLGIEDRNQRKRDNINKLLTQSDIKGIPYRLYYMSCNMDHAFHSNANARESQKKAMAHEFQKIFKDNLPNFYTYLKELLPSSPNQAYDPSWDYIKRELHSLERGSNLYWSLPPLPAAPPSPAQETAPSADT